MSNLTFSPGQARSVAKSILNKGRNANEIVEQLDREINSVEGWWKGESSQAFVQEFRDLKPNLKKLVECVENISKNLDKIADIKEQSERDIASALRK
ncbi:WXG100 family type VII secretion target [Paenibacillus bouchesdurhonensis]|uniref:WXG100 family type VII secretion target n=1 Tax=Paenibacillus bouchesdurhonensis TaxID=1870990 RepID=UPI000DA5EF8B|nr:WXG100 family type VII secretion target [Paenibacillus bouchesdurhonensis]